MIGFNGGLIGGLANARTTSTLKSNPGVWTLAEQRKAIFSVPPTWPNSLTLPTVIGEPFGGGYFAGNISHTANGTATHVLIVAPIATGATGQDYPVTTNKAWKTANTTTAGTTSPFDGAANTAAMVADGIANHPAANFCVDLAIGGFTDWYLPSRYELDIAYFNLKPTTASNDTNWGINDYSVPKRTANNTAGAPARTSLADFQSGGAQAFIAGFHWSSTEISATYAWIFNTIDGSHFNSFEKNNATRVRAFRRVAI